MPLTLVLLQMKQMKLKLVYETLVQDQLCHEHTSKEHIADCSECSQRPLVTVESCGITVSCSSVFYQGLKAVKESR